MITFFLAVTTVVALSGFVFNLLQEKSLNRPEVPDYHSFKMGEVEFRLLKDGDFQMVQPPTEKMPFKQIIPLKAVPYEFRGCKVHNCTLVHKNRLEYLVTPRNAPNKNTRVSLWFYVNPHDKNMFNSWNVSKPFFVEETPIKKVAPVAVSNIKEDAITKASICAYSTPAKKKGTQTLQEVGNAAHGSEE